MTKFTKDGKALTEEQRIALRIFHGIYGYYYKPEYEEANELDRELIENPDFIKDLFSVVYGLQSPCGEILLRRMSMMSYDDIADELGISSAKARSVGALLESAAYLSASQSTSNILFPSSFAIASTASSVLSPIFLFGSLMILRRRRLSPWLFIS